MDHQAKTTELNPETRVYLDWLQKRKGTNPAVWTEDELNKGALLLAKACGHTGTAKAVQLLTLKAQKMRPIQPSRNLDRPQ